jgi:hypothetical protein
MEKDKKDYSAYKDSQGKFLPGNPGGVKPIGALTNKFKPKTTAKKRAIIDRMWVDMYEKSAEKIFKNILDMCVKNNEKALFTFAPYFLARNREVDNDKVQSLEGKSVEELKEQLQELMSYIEQKSTEGEKDVKE